MRRDADLRAAKTDMAEFYVRFRRVDSIGQRNTF